MKILRATMCLKCFLTINSALSEKPIQNFISESKVFGKE